MSAITPYVAAPLGYALNAGITLATSKTFVITTLALAALDQLPKADALIISLPCYAACIAAGALAPLCIAFCTILP